MKQTLQNLLSEGKTKQVIAELRQLTTNDTDLKAEIVQLSARFSKYEKRHLGNLEDPSVLDIELNRINNALLAIIDRLDKTEQSNKKKKWYEFDNIKSSIAILAGLAGILTFVFKYCIHVPDSGDGKPFSVVVNTHGVGGRQDIVQMKETKLVADFGGRRELAKVGENGQNTFNEVPAAFHNKRIGIGLQGTEGYALRFADSTYLLNGEPIYLAVVQDTKTRLIKAVIKTQNGDLLTGVTITTIGESAVTDAKGYFELTIPADKQQPNYPLTLTKKGYQTATETYIPQSQIAEFRLKK